MTENQIENPPVLVEKTPTRLDKLITEHSTDHCPKCFIHELSHLIYRSMGKSFSGHEGTQLVGIEAYVGHNPYRIYALQMAQNIATNLLGFGVTQTEGETWEDAQKLAQDIMKNNDKIPQYGPCGYDCPRFMNRTLYVDGP